MALPSAYLTSFKNVDAIFAAIKAAQAPPRFTQKFLEGLGFQNSNDRLFINLVKALGFLNDTGEPKRRYHEYLDLTRSETVLADAIREAYADLFRVNNHAENMSTPDVKNKMKALSEGQFTDRVLAQMAGTFKSLCKNADFSGLPAAAGRRVELAETLDGSPPSPDAERESREELPPRETRARGLAATTRYSRASRTSSVMSDVGRLYEFVYRATLTEEALGKAGRRRSRVTDESVTDVAATLSLELLDSEEVSFGTAKLWLITFWGRTRLPT